MPTLFISYKRGNASVAPLVSYLREYAKYNVWFDRTDILGDEPDWRSAVIRGIETSEAVVLCLTEQSCESKSIRFEVEKALEVGKPIFIIALEKINNKKRCLNNLGLPEYHQIDESFTEFVDDPWSNGVKKLLGDLKKRGLPVTRHDKKYFDPEIQGLFQSYFSNLRNNIGYLKLSELYSQQIGRTPLESIYFPVPIDLRLSAEIIDYRITDWWVGKRAGIESANLSEVEKKDLGSINNWQSIEPAVLDSIAGYIQQINRWHRSKSFY